MKTILLLTALLLSFTATAQIGATRIKRQLETSNPAEFQLNLRWGETVDFDLQFLSHGTSMDVTGATVTLHAVTNGMPTGTSFQMAGTAGSSGTVSFRIVVDEWLPYGLTTGTWTIECAQVADGRIMRASGVLKCSGIYYPSAISPLPVTWATNLWTAISGIQAGTNDWNAAFGWGDHALQGYLTAESDPGISVHNNNETAHASLLAGKVSATDTVYTDTVARAASALQAESDPLVAGHIKAITEGQIANWNSSTGLVDVVGDRVSLSPISTLATGAVITLVWDGTNQIDYVEVAQPFTLTNAFTVPLNNTTNLYKKGWIRVVATNACVNTIWDSRIEWDQGTPEFTCTGLYKFAFSSADGIKIQGRQEWPSVSEWNLFPKGTAMLSLTTATNASVNLTYCEYDYLVMGEVFLKGAAGALNKTYEIYSGAYANGTPSNIVIASSFITSSGQKIKFAAIASASHFTYNVNANGLGWYIRKTGTDNVTASLIWLRARKATVLEKAAYDSGWRPSN